MWTFIKHLVRGQLLKPEKAIKQGEPREEWEMKCASFFFVFFLSSGLNLETTPCVLLVALPQVTMQTCRLDEVRRCTGTWNAHRNRLWPSQSFGRRRAVMGKYLLGANN